MAAWFARCTLLPLSLFVAVSSAVHAQAVAPAPALTGATAAWTLKVPGGGEIRWQQVTPAGVLLVSTDAALTGVEIEHGVVAWQKPELGGPLGAARDRRPPGGAPGCDARPGGRGVRSHRARGRARGARRDRRPHADGPRGPGPQDGRCVLGRDVPHVARREAGAPRAA